MSNEKHVRNSFYNGSRIDDIEANENRGPAGPQGLPGFSPSASVTQTENGARIIITDKNGTTYADITNGRNGVDGNNGTNGFSPIAEVAEVEDGAQLTVTDNRGTTTALIRNGERGERGEPGERGESALTFSVGTVTEGDDVSVTNSGTDSDIVLDFVIPRGSDGAQGIQGLPGPEGFSPTVVIKESTNGHTVTITDKDGFHSFEVANGTDGKNGQNGENGQNGSDGAAATISIGNVETLPAGSSAYVVNTGNENAAVFDFGIPKGGQGPAGPSNVTPIITEGTEIADINGVKIYAPTASGSDSVVLVDGETVTKEELMSYMNANKIVYMKHYDLWLYLTYYSDIDRSFYFTCITKNGDGSTLYYYTISVTSGTYNRDFGQIDLYYDASALIHELINNGGVGRINADIMGKPLYSGPFDVSNVTDFQLLSLIFNEPAENNFEFYRIADYTYNNVNHRCKLYCVNGQYDSDNNIIALIFKGEIVLSDKIIVLQSTFTSSDFGSVTARQIPLMYI